LLRTYLTRLHGIAGLVQYYDAYFAVQEWKKLQTGAEGFETKALNILEVCHVLPVWHGCVPLLGTGGKLPSWALDWCA
jgi:hypothetical protein